MSKARIFGIKEPKQAAKSLCSLKLFYSQQVNGKKWVNKDLNFPHMCKITAFFKQPAVTNSLLLR